MSELNFETMTGAELIEACKAPSKPPVPEDGKRQRLDADTKSLAYIAVARDNDEPTVRHFHQALMDLNAVHEQTTPEQSLNYLKSFVTKENKGLDPEDRLVMFDADGVGSTSTSNRNPQIAAALAALRGK